MARLQQLDDLLRISLGKGHIPAAAHDVVRIKNQIPIVVLRGRPQPLKREKQHIAFGMDGHIRADYTRSRALRRWRGRRGR